MRYIQSAAVAALLLATVQPASAWEPKGPIEFVVPGGAGGGIDRTARAVQRYLEESKLVNVPINVVNKPGGSASVGMAYAMKQPADGHHFLVGSAAALITNKITGRNEMSFRDMDPVCQLFSEPIAFSAKAGGNIKTGKELLEKFAKDTGSVTVGLPSLGSTNHISISLAVKSVGGDPRKINTVAFNSSSESITAVLGGHIDIAVSPAGNVLSHVKSKTLNVLAITAAKRQASGTLAEVPSVSELGVDVDSAIATNRSIWAPKGMPKEAVAYWQDVFKKLSEYPGWQKFLADFSFEPNFLPRDAYLQSYEKRNKKIEDILIELGLAKKM